MRNVVHVVASFSTETLTETRVDEKTKIQKRGKTLRFRQRVVKRREEECERVSDVRQRRSGC